MSGGHNLYVDIETFSSVDLKKSNVYRYSEAEDFEVLMVAWALDDGPVKVATTREEINKIPYLWDDQPRARFVAHNAAFERVCLSRFARMPLGFFLRPEEWLDTQAVAAAEGWPQSLATLANRLEQGEVKDVAGKALISKFSKPGRNGRNLAADFEEQWAQFKAYCAQDVEVLRSIHKVIGDGSIEEHRVWCADQRINDRGIPVDTELVDLAIETAELNAVEADVELCELTGLENPRSVQQMRGWLQDQGVKLPNMQKGTIDAVLADPETPELVKTALELRADMVLAAVAKFDAAKRGVSEDSRLRGQFKYFGGHTGRWAGKGVQLQNLPRAKFANDAQTEAVIADLQMGLGATSRDLKALVRPMFIGPFSVADYSSIEARVVAWLAGEQWVLDAAEDNRDLYTETAQRMGGGLTRQDGKVAVLALGYGGGVGALRVMGGQALGDDNYLQMLVDRWRAANPRIAALWKELELAFRNGGQAGLLTVDASTKGVRRITLPSGRDMVYRGVRLSTNQKGKRQLCFDSTKFAGAVDWTWGGKLVENVTQAVARDVLAHAILACDTRGLEVVGHVHDEILALDTNPQALVEAMVETPAWAKGLPVAAQSYKTYRYKKD